MQQPICEERPSQHRDIDLSGTCCVNLVHITKIMLQIYGANIGYTITLNSATVFNY